MKFNDKLMKLRKENSLSQEELAEKLGVTRQTISKWELGQTTPDMDKLYQISNLFNISVDELIKETDDNYQNNPVKDSTKNRNIIKIILVVIMLIIIGFGIFSLFNNGNKSNDSVVQSDNTVTEVQPKKKNTGLFGWFFDIWDEMSEKLLDTFFNMADRMMEKGEEWEQKIDEKNEKESEEFQRKFQEQMNQMYENYENETDEMKEEVFGDWENKVDEMKEKAYEEYENKTKEENESYWNRVDKMMDKMQEYQKKIEL